MKAGQAAAAASVSVKALRYYEQVGLVRPSRDGNGYRVFTEADVHAVVEVRALMELGLTAREAEPFVACLRAGHEVGDDCADSVAAYQRKIAQTTAMIDRLVIARNELKQRMVTAARRGFSASATTDLATGDDPSPPPPEPLPDGLRAPADDGAARHLPGMSLPALSLLGTGGNLVDLDTVAVGRWVLFLYPLTGEPGVDIPQGWDDIPGARGCSQEACSFRDQLSSLREVGIEQVLALSSDATTYQQELAQRLHLPYQLLSDPDLTLADAIDLPTFIAQAVPRHRRGPQRLYKRLTLVLIGARIEHVFYPIFPPDTHAAQVVDWVREHPVSVADDHDGAHRRAAGANR